MASKRNRTINMPAPYLRRVWLEPLRITDRKAYPFCLPLLRDDFELGFDRAITIIVGENGTGKSTLPCRCHAPSRNILPKAIQMRAAVNEQFGVQ
jgi:hypothetical protein